MKAPPHYYSNLAPFRELFRTGHPILTYHHVGPRRRGARLKGLYVSSKLFERQMAELNAAGFSTAPFEGITAAAGNRPRVTITFDDGFRDTVEHALPVLGQHKFCAIQFLVAGLLGKTNKWQQPAGDITESLMDEVQVREWLAAGQRIGSHTQTHPRLTQIPPEQAKEEIVASRKLLEDRFGVAIEHFCYPYGEWNERVRDLVKEAGYRTACTTVTGINQDEASPYELKRFTARYPSRSLRNIWARLKGAYGRRP